MMLLLVGCSESSNTNSNSNSPIEKKEVEKKSIENKTNPTAWVGEWLLHGEDATTQDENAITLKITNNLDKKFDFEFKQAGEILFEASAKSTNSQ